MDIDWASEYAVKLAVDYFIEAEIPLTVFCTHKSAYIDKLINENKIDVGIHPNFVQPSSQGQNEDEIIEYCTNLLPETQVFRCHRWYAVNDIYDKLYSKGFRYESNICTFMDNVKPFVHRSGMISFPTFFEDGAYLYHKMDLDFETTKCAFGTNGLKVINIHPMHFALNTPYFSYMREIKDTVSREEWNSMNDDTIKSMTNSKEGITNFIKNLTEYTQYNGNIVSLNEAYHRIIIN